MNRVYWIAAAMVAVGLALEVAKRANIDWPDIPTPGPVEPDDPPGPLAVLVPDDKQRIEYREFFEALASVVEADAGGLTTTDQIRTTQQVASRLLVRAGQWPTNASLKSEIERRQQAAFGLESQQLTPALRQQIVAFYRQIAQDF